MLGQRALTASVGIPVTLAVIYLGGWYLVAVVILLTTLALKEFYRLAYARWPEKPSLLLLPVRSVRYPGYALAVLVPAVALTATQPLFGGLLVGIALALTMLALMHWGALARGVRATAASVWITTLGTLYLPGLFSYAVYLRGLDGRSVALSGLHPAVPYGACWLTLAVVACWATDIAAYAVGKRFGRHKLCPAVSPGKTVEGAIAGLVAATLVTASLGRWFGLDLGDGLILGAALGVAGQTGDLAESKLKRWAGVKDSGTILPGHGGVLDRFDSLLVNAPVAYYYLRFLLGP